MSGAREELLDLVIFLKQKEKKRRKKKKRWSKKIPLLRSSDPAIDQQSAAVKNAMAQSGPESVCAGLNS